MQNSISFSTLKNDKITYEIVLPHIAFAPIVKGQIIGRTDFYKNGELIASVPLVAEHAVNIIKQEKGFLEKLRDFLNPASI